MAVKISNDSQVLTGINQEEESLNQNTHSLSLAAKFICVLPLRPHHFESLGPQRAQGLGGPGGWCSLVTRASGPLWSSMCSGSAISKSSSSWAGHAHRMPLESRAHDALFQEKVFSSSHTCGSSFTSRWSWHFGLWTREGHLSYHPMCADDVIGFSS